MLRAALSPGVALFLCLIETNIRQRGIGNTNPVKFGRCLKELERIYGVRDGSAGGTGANQHTKELEPQTADEAFTQSDLASQFGMSVDTLNRYKQLADSIPEVQDLVETGIVTPSVARAIIKKLPEFQQNLYPLTLSPGRGDLCSFLHRKITMVT